VGIVQGWIPVTGRLVSRFCNRCGRRFELPGPEPGELGLERIGAVFRSCSACSRFVGIACCWDDKARLCVDDSAKRARRFVNRLGARDTPTQPATRRALAQLASAVLRLHRFGKDPMLNGQLSLPDWEDAWWEAGWLVLTVECRGDEAVEKLRALRLGSRSEALAAKFDRLTEAHGQARSMVETRLVSIGWPLRPETRHLLQPLRGPRLAVVTGLFVAALTVTTVLAGASIFGTGLRDRSAGATPGISQQGGGGVLGTSQGHETPAPAGTTHVSKLVAMLDFDILRIGSLKGASDDLVSVIGHADVVSFPSPFDRSVRFSGAVRSGFCLANEHLSGGRVSIALDLYAVKAITSGSLDLVVTAPDGFVTVASISAQVLRRLSAERWYRVSTEWMPGTREVIQVSQRGLGTLFVDSLDLGTAPSSSDPHSFCLTASGLPAAGQLVLDNLRVEQ
jgi:hypothetical protein